MSMDLYYEQRLRDEDIYLHSLWHQGPPVHLFTPDTRAKRVKKTHPQSDLEWPCKQTLPDPSPSGWPAPAPAPITRVLTPEEQAQFAATRIQNKAVTAVEALFAANLSDSDGEESDDDDVIMGGDGCEEYQFFLNLFTEEEGIRGYYEKNWERGDFVCLVCGGIGKRKKFKDLVAVVQHSASIARTKKKRAHRAYAQVVCRVLGWDIDRLPSIDSPLGKPVESQGNAEVATAESSMIDQHSALENVNNGEIVQKEDSDVDEVELPSFSVPGTSNVVKRAKKTSFQSDLEWPCEETPEDPSPSGWPSPTPTTRVLTPEEQAQFAATLIQNKAVTAVEAFFAGNLDSDEDLGGDGYEEYQFFLKLLTEEGEIKGYCEKNWEGGDFVCLVCGGTGKRNRFKNLVAVVQHSVMIARTKKKTAHRAYAQVVCRVLGWDIDRLPTIDSSLVTPIKSQGNAEVAIAESSMINQHSALQNVNNGEIVQKEVSDVDKEEELPSSTVPGTSNVVSDNYSLKDGDANNCLGNLDKGVRSSGGVVTCQEHSEE